jgi:hypothetical protein
MALIGRGPILLTGDFDQASGKGEKARLKAAEKARSKVANSGRLLARRH